MTERTVNVALIAFTDEGKNPAYGFRGDTVKVNADDLERFDGLNGSEVEESADENHPEPNLSAVTEADREGPAPLDAGAPAPDGDAVAKPAGNASIEEWQAYAESQGVDTEGKSRNDLREELS